MSRPEDETIGETWARFDQQVEQLLAQLRARRAGRLFLRVGRWLRLWRFS